MTETTYDNAVVTALAHEIKNPTALALAHIELARTDLHDQEYVSSHLTHIAHALSDINQLVQEMLFAVHGNALSYEFEICEVVEELLEGYRAALPGVTFTFANASPIKYYGQEQFLRIILSNLLKNSVEAVIAAPYPPHIIVTAEREQENICISICDNGVPGHVKPYSNGLGLNICRQLAAKMNGAVRVSPGSGGGCVAEVLLW